MSMLKSHSVSLKPSSWQDFCHTPKMFWHTLTLTLWGRGRCCFSDIASIIRRPSASFWNVCIIVPFLLHAYHVHALTWLNHLWYFCCSSGKHWGDPLPLTALYKIAVFAHIAMQCTRCVHHSGSFAVPSLLTVADHAFRVLTTLSFN